jgi:acyl dehydratase
MSVYSDMEHSNTAGPGGRLQLAPKNIHNDAEFARKEGFPRPIADGVIVTAWIEAELRELFGAGYFKGGRLMTKFIKPVFAGDSITIKMAIKEKIPDGSATRINLDILCHNQKHDVVTVATGSGLVT